MNELSLTPVQVPAAYEHVVERLRRSIWLGQVVPGDRLPSERELAEAFGVSRVTIREALRVLQGEGLIKSRRGNGGGTVIRDLEYSRAERVMHMLRSREQLGHVHQLRLAVEPMAAALAAAHATADEIARLEETQCALFASTGVDAFRRADSAFHLGVAAASANPILAEVIEDARAKLFVVLDVADFEVRQETSGRAHAQILAAITEHDAPRAEQLMKQHLEDAWAEITAIIDSAGSELGGT
jgi:GntR family transcriptional regulator, transcriptional repressor for pyruvate dehydrogenase complex